MSRPRRSGAGPLLWSVVIVATLWATTCTAFATWQLTGLDRWHELDRLEHDHVAAGECVLTHEDETWEVVSCDDPHDSQVYFVFDGPGPVERYERDAVLGALDRRCRRMIGETMGRQPQGTYVYANPPKPASWAAGDHLVRCVVYTQDGAPSLTSSAVPPAPVPERTPSSPGPEDSNCYDADDQPTSCDAPHVGEVVVPIQLPPGSSEDEAFYRCLAMVERLLDAPPPDTVVRARPRGELDDAGTQMVLCAVEAAPGKPLLTGSLVG